MSNVWENFLAATVMLASAGTVKQRLVDAYSAYLSSLNREELPKEIRDDFSHLSDCLCCVRPQRGESAIQATVRKMSDNEAGRYASQIVSMLGVIARSQQAARPVLRAVNSGDD
jgi:hypothetical protein